MCRTGEGRLHLPALCLAPGQSSGNNSLHCRRKVNLCKMHTHTKITPKNCVITTVSRRTLIITASLDVMFMAWTLYKLGNVLQSHFISCLGVFCNHALYPSASVTSDQKVVGVCVLIT